MTAFTLAAISIVLATGSAVAQIVAPVSIARNGWTVSVDREHSVLNIAHSRFGPLMNDVRLNLLSHDGLAGLKDWSIQTVSPNEVVIETTGPRTAWRFELDPSALKISSTSTRAVLTSKVPASRQRILARLIDTGGFPVTWEGTTEVASGYDGSMTRNRSYLPTKNSECMYFTLGQVSSPEFHGLFDRATDTAIDFTSQTRLERDAQDPDLLDATIPVPGSAMIHVIPDYYTAVLGVPYYVPFDDSHFPRPPMTWSTWTSYYGEVTESDVVRNTDWIAANLKPYGFEYVQLDDGYDREWKDGHHWIDEWDRKKFPHGPKWLANYIKSKGLHPGLWIVPNAYAGAVKQHPDWYLHYLTGKIVLDYNTPALDSTNPEVLDFVRHMFTTLDDWGFDYYKFDGEHALPKYIPGVDTQKLYDKSVDPLVAYHNRLKVIRDTIGPDRFIEGCPAGTPLNGIGYFNSYFNGDDVYNNWQGMYALFSSINANAFLNHVVVYIMPGEGMEIGPHMSVEEAERKRVRSVIDTARTRETPLTGIGTTLPEARTLVTYASLTGVAYPLASVLPELPQERLKLLKMTLPTMPILPADLFSRGTDMRWDKFKHTTPDYYIHNYPEILDLKVNAKSGAYDVAAFTNWRSGAVTRDISLLDKLGLAPGRSYAVFDFWNQKLLGVFKNELSLDIEPHDTRVLLIHPLLNRPQLVGTSRHITGAYSIRSLSWDSSALALRGSSQAVDGEPYTLWVHVPEGFSVSSVRATAKGKREIPVHHELAGDSLSIGFHGETEPVDWEIEFK